MKYVLLNVRAFNIRCPGNGDNNTPAILELINYSKKIPGRAIAAYPFPPAIALPHFAHSECLNRIIPSIQRELFRHRERAAQ